jgi:hypothetical protein
MWNYRIIEHDLSQPSYYGLHEIYYDDDGRITNWTAKPIDITGESQVNIEQMLKQMILDCELPTLKESALEKSINQSQD